MLAWLIPIWLLSQEQSTWSILDLEFRIFILLYIIYLLYIYKNIWKKKSDMAFVSRTLKDSKRREKERKRGKEKDSIA